MNFHPDIHKYDVNTIDFGVKQEALFWLQEHFLETTSLAILAWCFPGLTLGPMPNSPLSELIVQPCAPVFWLLFLLWELLHSAFKTRLKLYRLLRGPNFILLCFQKSQVEQLFYCLSRCILIMFICLFSLLLCLS